MKAEDLRASFEIAPPRTIRPYKIVNDHDYLRSWICHEWKQPHEYSVHKAGDRFFHRRSECKICQAEKHRIYLRENPEKAQAFIERRKLVLQKEKQDERTEV